MNQPDKGALDIFGTRLQITSADPFLKLDGARMAAIRRLQGVSLDMLAGFTGYTLIELKAIEAGEMGIDRAMLVRVGDCLKCQPEDLLLSQTNPLKLETDYTKK